MAVRTNGKAGKNGSIMPFTPEMVCNALIQATRRGLVGNLQSTTPIVSRLMSSNTRPKINIEAECGYYDTAEMTPDFFRERYTRWGLGARVVNIWPDECFALHPEIYQNESNKSTTWERRLDDLVNDKLFYHHVHRLDRLSGIGKFGILFIGLNDGGNLERPPAGIDEKTGENKKDKEYDVNYFRAFDQALVTVSQIDTDPRSPRFGEPTEYLLNFTADQKDEAPLATLKDIRVHWTRVQHAADNRLTSEVNGEPRMKPVMDYLTDCRKILGGAGEMFWKGGFPGYTFEQSPELIGGVTLDEESVRSQMWAFQQGLQRYLATVGGKWSSLTPQVADPSNHLQWNINMICMTLGVPTRIFMGSESGHLASTKDDDHWRRRVLGRQGNYLEPRIMRPLLAKLMNLGVLPKIKKYTINWRDLKALSEDEKADIALKKVQALAQYATGDVNQLIPARILLTHVMGFTEETAQLIEDELARNPPPPPMAMQKMQQQAEIAKQGLALKEKVALAGRSGKAPRGKVGRPKGSPPEGKPRPTKPASSQRKPKPR